MGNVDWNDIPNDVVCQIISGFEISDIYSLLRTSRGFQAMTRQCITQLFPKELTKAHLSMFRGFSKFHIVYTR